MKLILLLLLLSGCQSNESPLSFIKYRETSLISVSIYGEVNEPGHYLIDKTCDLKCLIVKVNGYKKDALVLENKILNDKESLFINSNKIKDKINLNKASLEDLMKIPNIGKSIALKILDYRLKVTTFKSIRELLNIKGIKEKKFNVIYHYLTL